MVEPDPQQPLSGHVLVSAVATPRPNVGVQVGDRLSHAGMVGRQDRPAGGRVAQAVKDRHALGRPQDHVEAWHGPGTRRGQTGTVRGQWPARECNRPRDPPRVS